MKANVNNEGIGAIFIASICYFCWGLFPFFWKLLENVDPVQILLHRVLWSFVLAGIIILFSYRRKSFFKNLKSIWLQKSVFFMAVLSGFLITFNWGTYVWAVINEHLIEASIGYYISPIVSIILGYIFLGEKLNIKQKFAVILSVLGVLVLIIYNGKLPWVSLILAFSFGFYGLIKKKVKFTAMESLFFECAVVMPIVIPMLLSYCIEGSAAFAFNKTGFLLILAGPVTLIPLYLFATSVKRIKLSTMGFLQYICPTMTFLIGIFIFKESINMAYFIALVLIWIGIVLYLSSNYQKKK